jgi:hypothetical protein
MHFLHFQFQSRRQESVMRPKIKLQPVPDNSDASRYPPRQNRASLPLLKALDHLQEHAISPAAALSLDQVEVFRM